MVKNEETLPHKLSEVELSALCSWVEDCSESYEEIYSEFLVKIENASPDDYELLFENVSDIYWALDHIKNHIIDAEQGFTELMHVLSLKAEEKEKENGKDSNSPR